MPDAALTKWLNKVFESFPNKDDDVQKLQGNLIAEGYTTLEDLRCSGMRFADIDAKDLGLTKLRHRKAFLAAHNALQDESANGSPALTEVSTSPRSLPVLTGTPARDGAKSRASVGLDGNVVARGLGRGRGRGRAETLPAWHTNAAANADAFGAGGNWGNVDMSKTNDASGNGKTKTSSTDEVSSSGGCGSASAVVVVDKDKTSTTMLGSGVTTLAAAASSVSDNAAKSSGGWGGAAAASSAVKNAKSSEGWGSAAAAASSVPDNAAKSSGGWGSAAVASTSSPVAKNAKSSGGWGGAAVSTTSSAEQGKPSGGWGSAAAAASSAEQGKPSGGWGSAAAAASSVPDNAKSSGGWGGAAVASSSTSATVSDRSGAHNAEKRFTAGNGHGRGRVATLPAWHSGTDNESVAVRGAIGRGRGRASTLPAWHTSAPRPGGATQSTAGRDGDGASWSASNSPPDLAEGWGGSDDGKVCTSNTTGILPGDWTCRRCRFNNFASRNVCYRCDADRLASMQGDINPPRHAQHRQASSMSMHTRKRPAPSVVVDLTDDDATVPQVAIDPAGHPLRPPGSIVAERRAKRLAREAAAAKAAAASENSVSRVDRGRDPRRQHVVTSSSSIPTTSGDIYDEKPTNTSCFLLFTKHLGDADASGAPVGWLTFESMPTEWGFAWGFNVPDRLYAIVNRRCSKSCKGRFKDALEQLPYKAIYVHPGEITERRWKRFVQNFLTVKGEEQVAILKQPESYLYLRHHRLYYYASDDNGAPHLLESEDIGVTSSSAPSELLAQIVSPRSQLSSSSKASDLRL